MKLHDADHSTKEVYHAQIDKSELPYRFYWGMEVKGIYSPWEGVESGTPNS